MHLHRFFRRTKKDQMSIPLEGIEVWCQVVGRRNGVKHQVKPVRDRPSPTGIFRDNKIMGTEAAGIFLL
jgi:hypothetical protein